MYTQEAVSRLQEFIFSCGGVYKAALKLGVQASTLEKILEGRNVSSVTREKLEARLGPIPLTPSHPYQRPAVRPSKRTSPELLQRLQAFVNECHLVEEASARLRVRRSTIEKILAGQPVSLGAQQRIQAALNDGTLPNGSLPHHASMVEKLRRVHELYKQRSTLEAVGSEIGVTRERVRQLLVKGSRLGLFDYKPFDYPYVPKEKLVADYFNSQSLSRVARLNQIPTTYLRKLLTAYGIAEGDLASYRTEGRRSKILAQYDRLVNSLGHHPTTTELQGTPQGRSFHARILRLWGSIDAFREHLRIPKPPQGSPSFNEDMRPWREHKKRLALITRMQHLDLIRECLRDSGLIGASEIAYECCLKPSRIWKLLTLLMATGEVKKQGESAATRYRLVGR